MHEMDNINKIDSTKYNIKFRIIGGINLRDKFYCLAVHFDSLNLIHINQCTFSYKDVLVF